MTATVKETTTITMESLIERLKRDASEHGAITGEFCGTYAVLQHKCNELARYCTIRDTIPEDRKSAWRDIDDILSFIRGMLYGLEAGRLITYDEHYILEDIVTYTAYPKLD